MLLLTNRWRFNHCLKYVTYKYVTWGPDRQSINSGEKNKFANSGGKNKIWNLLFGNQIEWKI